MKYLKIILTTLSLVLLSDCIGQKHLCKTKYNIPKEQSEIRRLISEGKIEELKNINTSKLKFIDKNYKESHLLYAVREKQIEIIKFLLEIGLDINQSNKFGENALHYCTNDSELAAFLIQNGININKQNNNGLTPIMLTTQHGNINLVKFFIENKADLSLKDNEGKTVIDYANGATKIENNRTYKPIKELLKSKGATSGYILREAVICGNLEEVNEILKSNKSKPDAKDQFGSTVLVYTCNVEILNLLFEYGLDLDVKNQDDLTGLIFAARKGCYQAVKFYIEHGVDINAKQGNRTALDNAETDEIIELLITNGAKKGIE